MYFSLKKEKNEIFFGLSQLFWTSLEHMMFYYGREALVQNALKNVNIKDGEGMDHVKSLQSLCRASVMGIEKYTKVYASLYK